MRKFLASLLLSVTVLFGLAASGVTPVHAVATDCSQTAYLGDRICVDPTTAYGPLVQIFTPGGTYWNAFPVSLSNWNVLDSVVGHGSWGAVGANGAVTLANYSGGIEYVYIGSFSGAAPIAFNSNTTYDSWMVWFGNASAYPTMEFAIVT